MADDEFRELYARLRMFFARRGARQDCDDLASDVVQRVLTARASGREIDSLMGFAFGTAKLVWFEYLRRPVSEEIGDPVAASPAAVLDSGDISCLRDCLRKLAPESRRLFIAYFAGSGKNMTRRVQLAGQLGVNLNVLRLRIGALRATLRTCVIACRAALAKRSIIVGKL